MFIFTAEGFCIFDLQIVNPDGLGLLLDRGFLAWAFVLWNKAHNFVE